MLWGMTHCIVYFIRAMDAGVMRALSLSLTLSALNIINLIFLNICGIYKYLVWVHNMRCQVTLYVCGVYKGSIFPICDVHRSYHIYAYLHTCVPIETHTLALIYSALLNLKPSPPAPDGKYSQLQMCVSFIIKWIFIYDLKFEIKRLYKYQACSRIDDNFSLSLCAGAADIEI